MTFTFSAKHRTRAGRGRLTIIARLVRVPYDRMMKSGIIRSDEGYEILVDGLRRSFRDAKAVAYEAALFLKLVCKGTEKVEILERATGQRVEMFADGRVV